jgi:hypothetical protein
VTIELTTEAIIGATIEATYKVTKLTALQQYPKLHSSKELLRLDFSGHVRMVCYICLQDLINMEIFCWTWLGNGRCMYVRGRYLPYIIYHQYITLQLSS